MSRENIMERLASLFKEEKWGRIDPKDIGISKFKILEDFFNSIIAEGFDEEVSAICNEHVEESGASVTASYLLGLIAYHKNIIDDKIYLKQLIDLFLTHHKWAVVEHVAEKILEYGENRHALKALSDSLERLGRQKEAIPVWEDLLKLNRFDAEVAKKLSFAIIDDDAAKSVHYMKLSIEGFIKNGEFEKIKDLWNKLIDVAWDDVSFFDRIERMLVEAKRKDLAADMLSTLFEKFKNEDIDQSIEISKKILLYSPREVESRKALISLYTKKYGEHSQFEQFLKLSRLNNFNVPVKQAIKSFENNIVFDKGNYVYHRSWGLGTISSIDRENIIIDFENKPEHKMTVQMALQSLMPVTPDHFYVQESNDPEKLQKMFKDDFLEFFRLLIRSYEGEIAVSSIKSELIPKYVDSKVWSKWWSKARTLIKKDPMFGISDTQKDLIYMREKPLTLADELVNRFTKVKSFSEKLNVAYEFVNNIEEDDGASSAQYFIDFFKSMSKEGSSTKLILSYFVLRSFEKFVDDKKMKLEGIHQHVINFIKKGVELSLVSRKITSYDYKKEFIDLIEETRDDWVKVVTELLFETPVRIHRYIVNVLIRARAYQEINNFIERVIVGAKQFPEIFLWVARSILTRVWDYEWLEYSKPHLILSHFRVINELKKIEVNRNKLKNFAVDILFDNDAVVLKEVVDESEINFLYKLYDIAFSAGYLEESHLDKFLTLIRKKYPEFKLAEDMKIGDVSDIDEEEIFVTKQGFERKQKELNHLVNVEMVQLSKELAKTADVTGDVRENVDYNALMEKQTILELSISRIDEDLKHAKIIKSDDVSTEVVNIGTIVEIKSEKTGEVRNYSILGPWDADYDKNILSYRLPISKALLKKKIGETVSLRMGEDKTEYIITSIQKYKA